MYNDVYRHDVKEMCIKEYKKKVLEFSVLFYL